MTLEAQLEEMNLRVRDAESILSQLRKEYEQLYISYYEGKRVQVVKTQWYRNEPEWVDVDKWTISVDGHRARFICRIAGNGRVDSVRDIEAGEVRIV